MHNFSQLVSDCLDRRRETESEGKVKSFFRGARGGGAGREGIKRESRCKTGKAGLTGIGREL